MAGIAVLLGLGLALAAQAPPDLPAPLRTLDTSALPADAAAALRQAHAAAIQAPDDADAIGRLGMALHAWEQWEAALSAYAHAERLAPREYRWPHLAGLLETRRGRHQAAVEHFERAAAHADDPSSRLRLAEARLEAGDAEGSRTLFAELARLPRTRAAAEYGLGRIAMLDGAPEQALRHFDTAVAAYPDFGAAHYGRALALRRLGRHEDAEEALRRQQACLPCWPATGDVVAESLATIREDSGALLQRGIALARGGEDADAIELHERALALDPDLGQAHVNLITLYGRRKEWARAADAYAAALRQNTHVAEAHTNYGQVLLAAGRPAEAAPVLRLAVAANPADAQAWNALGLALETTGDREGASVAYRSAVEHAPALRIARFNLARTLVSSGQFEEAIRELQKIQTPEDAETPRYRFALAAALVRAGRVELGRSEAQAALDLARRHGQTDLAAAIERDLAMLHQQ